MLLAVGKIFIIFGVVIGFLVFLCWLCGEKKKKEDKNPKFKETLTLSE